MQTVASLSQLQEAVQTMPHVRVRGGGTKTALSAGANLSVRDLSGVLAYNPSEYTFTALAGTPLAEVAAMLAEHGQFLPFDPPLVEAGATLGGTVAAGLSGAGRYRYGGVRDFLLGVKLVTGEGRIVFGGGKVVKNAAGFDIPKLLVGSCGRLGVLAELTFKVFPRPRSYVTIRVDEPTLDAALSTLTRLILSQTEPAALDLLPPGTLLFRIGGLETSLPHRVERLKSLIGRDVQVLTGDESNVVDRSAIQRADRGAINDNRPVHSAPAPSDDADHEIWRSAREFAWLPADHDLIKIPITPAQIAPIEEEFSIRPALRRYTIGGNLLWLAWPRTQSVTPIRDLCDLLHRPFLPILGRPPSGPSPASSNPFLSRLTTIFDPASRFTAPT